MKPGKTKIRKLQIANNCRPKMEQKQDGAEGRKDVQRRPEGE